MRKAIFFFLSLASIVSGNLFAQTADQVKIKLPAGFHSEVIGKNLDRARHIVVNSNGDIYIKLARVRKGGGIVRLRDKNGDGKIDDTLRFCNYGGTGIGIRNGYLYATSNTGVFRYKLINNEPDTAHPEVIVGDLVAGKQHETKSITFDNNGNIYVTIGAPSNACQLQDRVTGAPGQDPCPLLEKTGGIWQFKADKKEQSYEEGVRYATGIRNVVGLDWNTTTNTLFAMQHGRDGLQDYHFFPDSVSVELPAEEMLEVSQPGDNFGWPYCFYNQFLAKKVLNPEYGGDAKTVGRCEGVKPPVLAFPGHMAPNGLLFYTGTQFPERYRNGAFVAFHGSWNRAPLEQKGFLVAFVPFKNGKPSGSWEIFASGFAGKENIATPGQAIFRPCGLAQGPDGSLYVTDDVKGYVWKIGFAGTSMKTSAKKPVTKTATKTGASFPASAGTAKPSTAHGKAVYAKYCLTCHQVDGSGVQGLNPPLTRTKWTLGSKTVMIRQVLKGSSGKVEIDGDTFRNTMPPLKTLTDQQIADVLTYVRNNFGNKASAVSAAEVKSVRAGTK